MMTQESDLYINLGFFFSIQLLIRMFRFLLGKRILLLLIVQYTFTTVSSYLDFLTGDGEASVPTFAPTQAGSNGM